MNSSDETGSFAKNRALFAALAAVLAGAVYLNALHNPFVYDDRRMIVENTSIQSLHNLRAIVWHDIARPLINLSYAVDYAAWGSAPFGFHLTNVLLHVINVLLLFRLALLLVAGRPASRASRVRPTVAAFAASTLLAIHPLMTESVGYISGRPEVLSGTFFLLALLFAVGWMERGGPGRWTGTIAFWGLALSVKETAVVFPLVALCCDALVLQASDEERRRRRMRLHTPLFAFAFAAGVARLAVLIGVEHPGPLQLHWKYALVELDVLRQYLLLFLLPQDQAIFHAVSPVTSPFHMGGLLLLAGSTLALAWRARILDPVITLGAFWFVLLLLPSAALVVFDRGEAMAEHRVYMASMGLFLATGSGIGWLWGFLATERQLARIVLRIVLALHFALFCAQTLFRNLLWSDPVALWQEARRNAPDSWVPRLGLAEALQDQGRCPEAILEFRAAMLARPEQRFGYSKLGACLIAVGQLDDAAAVFAELRALEPTSPEPSIGDGMIAMARHSPHDAKQSFLEALDEDPENVTARRLLVWIVEPTDPAEALRLCREIRQLAPGTEGNDDCIRRNQARTSPGSR